MGSYPDEFPFNIMDVVELLHLRIRRQQSNSVYVDCPFCGDRRGKMNVNFVKNVWRCNYCGEHGGMLGLYARLNNTTTSDAYWEIAEALCDNCHEEHIRSGNEAPKLAVSTGSSLSGARADAGRHSTSERKTVPQSEKASPAEIHQTLSLLLAQLTLRPAHREHLRSPKRGLSDEQIESLGFKSTPPPFLCRSITARLIQMGCKVEGVPGFYRDDCGYWTMAFYKKTSGILIPAVGFDGRLQGFQIMLDVPLKDKDDPPEKAGAKYIWFSSSSKRDGASSGSPVHLVGDPSARVVYVIEGLLKADISHCLTGRTFAAIAGANNTSPLDPLFALLAQSGTEEIIEAHDMDKYNNQMTMAGASKIYLTARKYGMNCRRLTWNPNYKGFDDWQLALRRENQRRKELERKTFKEQYGTCLSYRTGSQRECLLAAFDSNKKIILIRKGDEIVARACIRLTKGAFQKPTELMLSFADLAGENTTESSHIVSEKLVLFLERIYTSGINDDEQQMVMEMAVALATQKATELGAVSVLARRYVNCYARDQYVSSPFYVYISKSKNGQQYLDSLGGAAMTSRKERYVEGAFLVERAALHTAGALPEKEE